MADPFTLIAAGLTAASSIAGGMAANSQEKANAATAEANARETGRTLAADDSDFARKAAAQTGETLTSIGANGLTLSGSALDVTRQNIVEAEYERLRSRRDRVMEIDNLKYQGEAAKARGKQAMIGGILGAVAPIAGQGKDLFGGKSSGSGRAFPKGW